MELNKFSKEILNKDIPILTLKLILYMVSSNKSNIEIDEACSSMYCTKKKLTNELKSLKPIDGFLEVSLEKDGYQFNVCGKTFELLDIKNKKKSKKDEKNALVIKSKNDAVQIVFDYWILIMKKTSRTTLDSERRKFINKALESFTIEECKLAILGCSKTLWNMGKDEKNTTLYNGLNLIFRNQDKTSTFISNADKPSIEEQLNLIPKSNKIEDRLKDNEWFEQRSGMMGGDLSKLRENVEKVEKNNKTEKIEYKNEYLIEENKINNDIDLIGLIEKSEKAFCNLEENEVNINSDIIEAEIVDEVIDEPVPFYLQVLQNKET